MNASVKIISKNKTRLFGDLDFIMDTYPTAGQAAVARRTDGFWAATVLLHGANAKSEQRAAYEALGRRSMR